MSTVATAARDVETIHRERVALLSCGYESWQREGRPADGIPEDRQWNMIRRAIDYAMVAVEGDRVVQWTPAWPDLRAGDLVLFRLAEHLTLGASDQGEARWRATGYVPGAGQGELPGLDGLDGLGSACLTSPGYHGLLVVTSSARRISPANPGPWLLREATYETRPVRRTPLSEDFEAEVAGLLADSEPGAARWTVLAGGCVFFTRPLDISRVKELKGADPDDPALLATGHGPCEPRDFDKRYLEPANAEALLSDLSRDPRVAALRRMARAIRAGHTLEDAQVLGPRPRGEHESSPLLRMAHHCFAEIHTSEFTGACGVSIEQSHNPHDAVPPHELEALVKRGVPLVYTYDRWFHEAADETLGVIARLGFEPYEFVWRADETGAVIGKVMVPAVPGLAPMILALPAGQDDRAVVEFARIWWRGYDEVVGEVTGVTASESELLRLESEVQDLVEEFATTVPEDLESLDERVSTVWASVSGFPRTYEDCLALPAMRNAANRLDSQARLHDLPGGTTDALLAAHRRLAARAVRTRGIAEEIRLRIDEAREREERSLRTKRWTIAAGVFTVCLTIVGLFAALAAIPAEDTSVGPLPVSLAMVLIVVLAFVGISYGMAQAIVQSGNDGGFGGAWIAGLISCALAGAAVAEGLLTTDPSQALLWALAGSASVAGISALYLFGRATRFGK